MNTHLFRALQDAETRIACRATRQAIERRTFSAWRGLPPQCRARELFDGLPDDVAACPRRKLGSRSATWALLDLEGYRRPRASFVDGELVMFDGGRPDLAVPFTRLFTLLGDPSGVLDWWDGFTPMRASQLVYADRGITLYVDSQTSCALHVAVYRATTLRGWVEGLEPVLRARRVPVQVST